MKLGIDDIKSTLLEILDEIKLRFNLIAYQDSGTYSYLQP